MRETVGRLDGLGETEGNENWDGITGNIRCDGLGRGRQETCG